MNLSNTAARGGACLLIAASAALGTVYAYKLGSHFGVLVGVAFAAMALGGELLKPVAVERAFSASWRRPGQALACVAVASISICYSLAAELAFSAGARGDLAAERKAETEEARSARGTRERAEAELSSRIWPKQNVAELEELQRKWKASSDRPWNRTQDLANARRKAELERTVAAHKPAIERESDPQAAAVVAYLAAAGVQASPAAVATWLHLLPVLLLEIGSAFELLVARGERSVATVAEVRSVAVELPTVAPVADVFRPAQLPANVVSLAGKRRALGPMVRRQPSLTVAGGDPVLEALEAAGRPLSVSELAAAMRVSVGEASKRWRELGDQVEARKVGKLVLIGRRAS